MEPIEDDELKQLLRQWEGPEVPDHLRDRVFGAAPARGRLGPAAWLLTGSVRVPVPAVAVLLVLLAWLAAGRLLPVVRDDVSERPVSLADFQPAAEMRVRIVGELP